MPEQETGRARDKAAQAVNVPPRTVADAVTRQDVFRPAGTDGRKAGQAPEVLLTERGYLVLVKTFRDDLSWRVQEELVDGDSCAL